MSKLGNKNYIAFFFVNSFHRTLQRYQKTNKRNKKRKRNVREKKPIEKKKSTQLKILETTMIFFRHKCQIQTNLED